MAHHHPAAPSPAWSRRKLIVRVGLTVVALAVAYGGFQAASLWWSWRSLEREAFDDTSFEALAPVSADDLVGDGPGQDLLGDGVEPIPLAAETVLTEILSGGAGSDAGTATSDGDDARKGGAGTPDERYDAYLVVGSDLGDHRADVIILVLLPTDGSTPIMVSLPRDLYLPNRCTRSLTRINANYNGCGPDLNGPTQLAGAVKDFTGIEVDHFALFTMVGFERIIDAIGGMEICVEHPVREGARLDLPAGCSHVDGTMALGWVRSRKTRELVDGRWRYVPGVNDLTRNQRQQDLILAVLARAGEFDSPGDLTRFAASLSDAFTLDDQLGLTDAVGLAWSHRNITGDDIVRLTIPVQPYTTSGGAQVLLPTATFGEVLAGASR